MQVLLLNGSPRKNGCTFTALSEIARTLEEEGILARIFQAGDPSVENVRAAAALLKESDGLIIGSPVYYSSPTGQIISFMDKLAASAGNDFLYKPAGVIVSARRAGTTASLEVLEKYPQFFQMPLVSSKYWNMVHGNTPEEVAQDEEGLQIMRTLARNMAWLLKCIEAGKAAGITPAAPEEPLRTSFIR